MSKEKQVTLLDFMQIQSSVEASPSGSHQATALVQPSIEEANESSPGSQGSLEQQEQQGQYVVQTKQSSRSGNKMLQSAN